MNRTLNIGISRIQFKNSHTVYENFIKCTVKDYEYNLSYNPTLLSGSQGLLVPYSSSIDGDIFYVNSEDNYGILKDFTTGSISGSDFSPYVGAVGLYNDAGDLLAIGKMAAPMSLSSNTDVTFLMKLDTQWSNRPYFTPTPSVTRTPNPTPSVTPSFNPTPSVTPTPSSFDCAIGTATALYIPPSPSLTPTPSTSKSSKSYTLIMSVKYDDVCNNTGTNIPGVIYDGATFCTSTIFTSNTFAGYNQSPVFLSDGSGYYISATKINTTTYQALTACTSCPVPAPSPIILYVGFNYSSKKFTFDLSTQISDNIVIGGAKISTYQQPSCATGLKIGQAYMGPSTVTMFAGNTYVESSQVTGTSFASYKFNNSITVNGTTLFNGSRIDIGLNTIIIDIPQTCVG